MKVVGIRFSSPRLCLCLWCKRTKVKEQNQNIVLCKPDRLRGNVNVREDNRKRKVEKRNDLQETFIVLIIISCQCEKLDFYYWRKGIFRDLFFFLFLYGVVGEFVPLTQWWHVWGRRMFVDSLSFGWLFVGIIVGAIRFCIFSCECVFWICLFYSKYWKDQRFWIHYILVGKVDWG